MRRLFRQQVWMPEYPIITAGKSYLTENEVRVLPWCLSRNHAVLFRRGGFGSKSLYFRTPRQFRQTLESLFGCGERRSVEGAILWEADSGAGGAGGAATPV